MSDPSATPPSRRWAGAGRDLVRWALLGAASGVLAGVACWVFLTALDDATEARLEHPWLIWLLPVAGLAIGWSYHRFGGRAAEGNALLLDQIHRPTEWVPRRMAPMVGVGTVVSHLVGASVGREGTALQMSGSLTDVLARRLRLGPEDRRILLTAAVGGGFGAVFGVPLAGLVFGLEVQRVTWHPDAPVSGEAGASDDRRPLPWWVPTLGALAERRRAPRPVLFAGYRGGRWIHRVVATAAASVVGDRVVHALGHDHAGRPQLDVGIDAALLGRAALAGIAFGLVAIAFVELTDVVRAGARQAIRWAPARPAAGGVLVLVGVALVGRDYLGLSLPLIDDALAGGHTDWTVPLLKLAFTALCLGTGFIGGEVTPLFVIGATLGSVLAPGLGLDPVVGAAIGFVAVFGGATNTPIACTAMAFELFGGGAVPPAAVACAVAYLCSGRRGIYPTQLRRSAGETVPVSAHPELAERLSAARRRRSPTRTAGTR